MAATDNAAEQVAHIAEKIRAGKTTLGIEFGSTRIKAVLIDDNFQTIASGDYSWASHLEDGLWSYTTEEIWGGLQSAYASMANDVETAYGEKLTHVGHIGFSAMMHGYLAFDEAGELLVSAGVRGRHPCAGQGLLCACLRDSHRVLRPAGRASGCQGTA